MKKTFLKKAAVVICMAGMAVSLAACGSSQKTGSDNPGTENSGTQPAAAGETTKGDAKEAASGEVLTIEFFQQKGEEGPQKGYKEIIEKFNAANPDIKIEMNTVPDAGTVLVSRISSGDIPVIFSDYPTQKQFKEKVANGYVQDLTDQQFLTMAETSALEMTKQPDGKYYALPYSRNYMGVYYNKDIFKQYNLEVPTTWAEFTAVCDTLKEYGVTPMGLFGKDPGRVGHTFQCTTVAWAPDGVTTLEKAAAGEATVSDDPEFKAAAEKMLQLLNYSNEDALALSDTNCWEAFANGKYGMIITGSYARGTIQAVNPSLNFGVFPVPNDTKETTNTLAGIDAAICISAKASEEEKAAAYKFLDFLAQVENAQVFCDNDGAPSCIIGVAPNYDGIEPMTDLINAGQVHDWMASTIDSNVVNDLYNVTQGFWGEKNIDNYLKQMDESIKINSVQ